MMSSRDPRHELRLGAMLLALAGLAVAGSWAWRSERLWFVHPPASSVRILDVSRFQGEIDWRKVPGDGVAGAWIKASEGGDLRDPRFAANREGARAAHLAYGAYHFFTFCRPAEDQAANFLGAVGDDWGSLPPAVDVETGGNCAAVPTPTTLRVELGRFLDRVELTTGRPTLLYVIPEQLPLLFGDELPERPLWVRSLLAEPTVPGRPVAVWQFHSRGWVSGVSGAVDLNAVEPDIFATWTGGAAR